MVFSPTGDIAPTFAPKKAKVKKEQKNFCPSHTQASPFGGESKPPPPGEVAARRADGEGYAHRTPCGFVGADAHAQRKSPWGTSARKTFATAAVDGGAMWASPPTTSQEPPRTPCHFVKRRGDVGIAPYNISRNLPYPCLPLWGRWLPEGQTERATKNCSRQRPLSLTCGEPAPPAGEPFTKKQNPPFCLFTGKTGGISTISERDNLSRPKRFRGKRGREAYPISTRARFMLLSSWMRRIPAPHPER